MRENLALELLERLVERGAERVATAATVPEAPEILDGPVETVPRDQVVGHEERELVGRQRAFLEVADGEATGRAERVEIEISGNEGSVRADAGGRDLPTVLHRVEPEAFEDVERDPLRHAFRQPLLGASLALRQLDLGHVRELVSDQPQPLAAAVIVRFVVEEQLPTAPDADREVAELRGPYRRHVGIANEALLEHLARRVDEDGHPLRHRQLQGAHEEGGAALDGAFVIGQLAAVGRHELRVRVDRDRKNDATSAASSNDHDRDEEEEAANEAVLPQARRVRQTDLLEARDWAATKGGVMETRKRFTYLARDVTRSWTILV